DRRGHERVAERVYLLERGHHRLVTEVIHVLPLRYARRGHRLDRDEPEILCLAGQLVADKREGEPAEVRATADAAHKDVRLLARELELLLRLLTDHRLMHEHVIQDRAE